MVLFLCGVESALGVFRDFAAEAAPRLCASSWTHRNCDISINRKKIPIQRQKIIPNSTTMMNLQSNYKVYTNSTFPLRPGSHSPTVSASAEHAASLLRKLQDGHKRKSKRSVALISPVNPIVCQTLSNHAPEIVNGDYISSQGSEEDDDNSMLVLVKDSVDLNQPADLTGFLIWTLTETQFQSLRNPNRE